MKTKVINLFSINNTKFNKFLASAPYSTCVNSYQQMIQAGFKPVDSFNPYWQQQGQTFQDYDGYRTVLQCQQWPQA